MTLEARRPGATVIPIIISTDRTQVTQFGGKTAYPMYMTIGNLPKDIRDKPSHGGQILLAYLPDTKLKLITNKAARRRMVTNLFHACLRRIMKPLVSIGICGMAMKDGTGAVRRVHPILAVFVGDYPKQVLVTGVKYTECPKCTVSPQDLGKKDATSMPRNILAVRAAIALVNGNLKRYKAACKEAGIKPIYPFWAELPYADIFQSITPDILHQLLQGLFWHIFSWIYHANAYGQAEIDARFKRAVPNHHIRVFTGGVTELSRVTGKEHNFMARLILGVIADMRLARGFDSARLIRAVRALLDFMYISQLPLIWTNHLDLLERALDEFHDNKTIFVDLGIRAAFNLPKLHACLHYVHSIKLFRTPDNYDMQYTEVLHKKAKASYRASNMKDEYPQMTAWLERREQVVGHEKYIQWREDNRTSNVPSHPPRLTSHRHIKMTCFPSVQSVSVEDLISNYGATFFHAAFARFVVLWQNPQITRAHLEQDILDVHIPFTRASVYHRIRFVDDNLGTTVDSIRIRPQ